MRELWNYVCCWFGFHREGDWTTTRDNMLFRWEQSRCVRCGKHIGRWYDKTFDTFKDYYIRHTGDES